MRTAALVGRDGAIDWLGWPRFDSPACFAALLGGPENGRWRLAPADPPVATRRRYRPQTLVLETDFATASGRVRVIDFMPPLDARSDLVRIVEGLEGVVAMHGDLAIRFDYGAIVPWVERTPTGIAAIAGPDALALTTTAPLVGEEFRTVSRFSVRAGDRVPFVLTYHPSHRAAPVPIDAEAACAVATQWWRDWCARSDYRGDWSAAVCRSLVTLKALTFAPTGGIVAAPTTSLPEAIGGERNWDYRYSWIRDSSFTLEALLQLGKRVEATAFFWWFMHATRLTLPRLRVLYRLDGGADAAERPLALEGYRGSRPVRIGNRAAGQLQLDTYGELLDAAFVYATAGHHLGRDTAHDLARVADFVCRHWREPDSGIWEVRVEPRHHTQSKAMCWVALDRAVRLAHMRRLPGQHTERWSNEAANIRRFIDDHCWSAAKGSYVWYAGSDELDASLLLMAIMRYEPPESPRLRSTVEAVRRELASGPLLYRYTGDDGIAGGEGAFVCCAFWLAEALAIAGRREEANVLFENLLRLANDLGLYAEEIAPETHDFLGNFPQGLVHLALISAAMAMAQE
jgi:GH15 family glucan-1,4-alpha-glucosidase